MCIYIAYISAYLNGVENINRLSYIPRPPAEVSYKIGSDRERERYTYMSRGKTEKNVASRTSLRCCPRVDYEYFTRYSRQVLEEIWQNIYRNRSTIYWHLPDDVPPPFDAAAAGGDS